MMTEWVLVTGAKSRRRIVNVNTTKLRGWGVRYRKNIQMNQRFLPGAGRDGKPGLEKHHKLKKSNAHSGTPDSEKTRSALPGNWMYNEAKAEEVWSELEDVAPKQFDDPLPSTSPLRKIEDSTSRIKKTISDFEMGGSTSLNGRYLAES